MTSRARTDSSNVVRYIARKGQDRVPVYGCGKSEWCLNLSYDMSQVNEKNICRNWLRNNCFRSNSECRFKHRLPRRLNLKPRKKAVVTSTLLVPTPVASVVSARGTWAKRVQKDALVTPETVTPAHSLGTSSSASLPDKAINISDTSVTTRSNMSFGGSTESTSQEVPPPTVRHEPLVATGEDDPWEPAAPAPPSPQMKSMHVSSFPSPPATKLAKAPVESNQALLVNIQESYAHAYVPNVAPLSEENLHAMNTTLTAPMSYGNTAVYQPPELMPTPSGYTSESMYSNVLSTVQQKNAELAVRNAELSARVDALKAEQEQMSYAHQTELGRVQRELTLSTKREFEAKQAGQRALSEKIQLQRALFEKIQLQAHYEMETAELSKQVTNLKAEAVVYLKEIDGLKFALREGRKELERTMNLPAHDVQPASEPASVDVAITQDVQPASPVFQAVAIPETAITHPAPVVSVEEVPPVSVEELGGRRIRRKRAKRAEREISHDQDTIETARSPVEVPATASKPENLTGDSPNKTASPVDLDLTSVCNPQEFPPLKRKPQEFPPLKTVSTHVEAQDVPPLKTVPTHVEASKKPCCLFEAYDMGVARKQRICEDWLCGLCTCKYCAHYKGCETCNCFYKHEMPTVHAEPALKPVKPKRVRKTKAKTVRRSRIQAKLSKFASRQRSKGFRKARKLTVCGTGIAH